MKSIGAITLLVLLSTVATAQEKGAQAPKVDPAIQKLVDQLKSSDFKTRQAAEKELLKLEQVPEPLREAAKSGDLETRRRAQAIVAAIMARLEEKAFQAMVADMHKIELDRFIRRMVTDEKFAEDNKHWGIIETFAKAVIKRANDMGGRKFPVPEFDMKSMPTADLSKERVGFNNKRLLLRETDPRSTSIRGCVVLCAGNMPRTTSLSNSIAMIDGDFIGATGIDNSLVIVRGNVGRVTGVQNSIVIATGNFEGATSCNASFLQVNNHWIRFTGSKDSVLVKTQVRTTGPTNSVVLDSDKGPLQLLKFSPRKSDEELKWGKDVNGLAVAITPANQKDRFLIRWKNVGQDTFVLPTVRLNRDVIDTNQDDLLDHVFLKGRDDKLAAARKYPVGKRPGLPFARSAVVLGPGKIHEEVIDLWNYVDRPAAGRYQLSIEFDPPEGRRALVSEFKTWSGKVRSNVLNVEVGK